MKVVEGLSCAFPGGGLYLLGGNSGSGKTTLINLVNGTLTPSAGAVLYRGADLATLEARAACRYRARTVAQVHQVPCMFGYLSVLENITIGPLMGAAAGERKPLMRKAKALLERFRLSDRARHLPSELSVGQLRRVALARALATEPEILLADEPTNDLDRELAGIVVETLVEQADRGVLVIVASHDAAFGQMASDPPLVRMASGCGELVIARAVPASPGPPP